jgi:DNA gyrase subunit A
MIKTPDFNDDKYIVMVTKKGKIKRTNLSVFKHVKKKGLIATNLEDGDEIAGVRLTNGSNQLLIATKLGMIIRINENIIRSMSRVAQGVKAIRLREGDEVVSMARVREGATVFTITDKGLGRKTSLDAYRVQNRGGYGMYNYKVSESRGNVCGIKVVDDSDDIIMMSTNGIVIRIRTSDIRPSGRTAGGVKVMKLDPNDRIVAFTRTEHDDGVETETIEDVEVVEDQE